MKIDIENLPSESNILQQIISELSTENHSLLYEKEALKTEKKDLRTKNHYLLSEIELLKEQLKILKARRTELMRVLKIQKKLEDMGKLDGIVTQNMQHIMPTRAA